jgi:hypothetical protein
MEIIDPFMGILFSSCDAHAGDEVDLTFGIE